MTESYVFFFGSYFGLNEGITTLLFSMFGIRKKHTKNPVEHYVFETHEIL